MSTRWLRPLTRLLTDDALANLMSRQAPEFVQERFDIDVLTPTLEAVYDHVATASQVRPGV